MYIILSYNNMNVLIKESPRGMQISAALPSMTAAPSNVKNREIHKGGYKQNFGIE